jgi:hypothetical protein
LGRDLVEGTSDIAQALWSAPRVIVAHAREEDPIFFFGNRCALERFEIAAQDFIKMPSRLSAQALAREERQRLLQRVTDHGFIDDYAGVRISARGKLFRIEKAIVWNLLDSDGQVHGQAATFTHWTDL